MSGLLPAPLTSWSRFSALLWLVCGRLILPWGLYLSLGLECSSSRYSHSLLLSLSLIKCYLLREHSLFYLILESCFLNSALYLVVAQSATWCTTSISLFPSLDFKLRSGTFVCHHSFQPAHALKSAVDVKYCAPNYTPEMYSGSAVYRCTNISGIMSG